MRILVFNAGSSSLKFGIFDLGAMTAQIFKGSFERFRDGGCNFRFQGDSGDESGTAPHGDLAAAIGAVPEALAEWGVGDLDAVGHRIAHGGPDFSGPRSSTTQPAADRGADPLAPLHNPANLEAVRVAMVWPDLPQVGVFDTAFHLTNPARATTYAVPEAWREAGLRRYGFHGTSHRTSPIARRRRWASRSSSCASCRCTWATGPASVRSTWGRSLDTRWG
jgi:acetate kinase